MVEALLIRGIFINAKNRVDKTALHLASEARDIKVVQKLLKSNADAIATNLYGKTALQNTAKIRNGDIIKRILVHLSK